MGFLNNSISQDTLKFQGIVGRFLLESFEFYADSTFKWTREYDLRWSTYGTYTLTGTQLKLQFKLDDSNFYFSRANLKGDLKKIKTVQGERILLLMNDKLYALKSNGQKRKWIKNDFFWTKWSWLTFGYRRLHYRKINN